MIKNVKKLPPKYPKFFGKGALGENLCSNKGFPPIPSFEKARLKKQARSAKKRARSASIIKKLSKKIKCFGSLRGFSPLKNLPAGESPLHLKIRKNEIFTYLPLGIFSDCCSFYCDFPLPAVRLFPAFGSGRLTAAPEQPFMAAQALTSVRCASDVTPKVWTV